MAISKQDFSRINEQQAARDAVLAGFTDTWPAPDGAELVPVAGVLQPASAIRDLPTSARVEAALMAEIGALLKALKIRLPRTVEYPAAPVRADDYEPGLRATARKINQRVMMLRDVQHRSDLLIAAEESAARARRDKHTMALRQFLDEAPEKMRARADAVGDLGARAQRIVDFLTDVSVVAGAVAGAAHERKVVDLVTEAAAILNEPQPKLPSPQLPPEIHTLPVQKLAMLLGVPPAARAVDGHLVNAARAAVTALRGAQ